MNESQSNTNEEWNVDMSERPPIEPRKKSAKKKKKNPVITKELEHTLNEGSRFAIVPRNTILLVLYPPLLSALKRQKQWTISKKEAQKKFRIPTLGVCVGVDVGIKTLSICAVVYDSTIADLRQQFYIVDMTVFNLAHDEEDATRIPMITLSHRAKKAIFKWGIMCARKFSEFLTCPLALAFSSVQIRVEQQALIQGFLLKDANVLASKARQQSNHRINMFSMIVREHFDTVYGVYGGEDEEAGVVFQSARAKDCVVSWGEHLVPSREHVKRNGFRPSTPSLPSEPWQRRSLVYKERRDLIKSEIDTYRGRKKFSIRQTLNFLYAQQRCAPWLEWYETGPWKRTADPADALRHAVRYLVDQFKLSPPQKGASKEEDDLKIPVVSMSHTYKEEEEEDEVLYSSSSDSEDLESTRKKSRTTSSSDSQDSVRVKKSKKSGANDSDSVIDLTEDNDEIGNDFIDL